MGNHHYRGTNRKRYIFVWSLETNSLQFYCAKLKHYQRYLCWETSNTFEYSPILFKTHILIHDGHICFVLVGIRRIARMVSQDWSRQAAVQIACGSSLYGSKNKTPNFCVILTILRYLRSHFEASCGNLQTSVNFILWRYLDLWFGRSVHHGTIWQGIPNNWFFSCFMKQWQILLP